MARSTVGPTPVIIDWDSSRPLVRVCFLSHKRSHTSFSSARQNTSLLHPGPCHACMDTCPAQSRVSQVYYCSVFSFHPSEPARHGEPGLGDGHVEACGPLKGIGWSKPSDPYHPYLSIFFIHRCALPLTTAFFLDYSPLWGDLFISFLNQLK